MCLDIISELHTDPIDKEWKIGYKVFGEQNDGSLRGPFFHFENSPKMKIGGTYEDYQNAPSDYVYIRKGSDIDFAYQTGFHIFVSFDGAVDLIDYLRKTYYLYNFYIVKVQYRGVTAIGKQENYNPMRLPHDCIVAQQIKLIEFCISGVVTCA